MKYWQLKVGDIFLFENEQFIKHEYYSCTAAQTAHGDAVSLLTGKRRKFSSEELVILNRVELIKSLEGDPRK